MARVNRSLGWAARAATATLALLAIGLVLLAGYSYARVARDLPSIETLPVLLDRGNGELLQPTKLLDRSGEVTLFIYQDEGIERRFLPIDPDNEDFISPQMIRSITATFDPTFWTNPGYNLRQWGTLEPTTIAERLVSDLILWDEPPSTARTMRMRILAGQVVAAYGRSKVIEWYLNSAWFGRYAYGVESAAQLYLGKSARDITLAESALLTSLINSPALNPIDAPDTAIDMQQELLRDMLASGAIIQEEYDLAVNEVITLRKPGSADRSMAAGFVKQVEKQLETVLSSQRMQRGGLVVITTLDADLQDQLACTANTQLIRLEYSNVSGVAPEQPECDAALLLPTQSFASSGDIDLAVAGLVMNPQSGEVLAYLEPVTLSGERLSDSGYQPGSLLTPIVAVGAFSRGYSPASLVWDIPSTQNHLDEGSTSTPETYHGAVNIRSAVVNDYLNPIAKLVTEIGAFNTWRSAAVVGLDALINPPDDPSPLFGGSESSLLQIGTAYSTLANSGVLSGRLDAVTDEIMPETVLKVTTTGNQVLWRAQAPENTVIISDTVTYLVNHVLSDESARWPSLGYPNELEIGSEVAAKTGSADDHRQVWTVGYTPQRLVLVWLGADGKSESSSILDERMAAGIWHAVFKYASQEQQFNGWARPAGITEMRVCSPSGMLPTRDCPNLVYEVFLYGNEPTLPDTLFTRVKVNRETGQMATVFTPPALVEEMVFMNIPPEARDWAESAGIAIVPQGYDSIQVVRVDPEANISQPAMFSPVAGKVTIQGTAADEDFTSYFVQVGDGINPVNWLQVNESGRQVEMGVLAEWDTSGLNGLYAIRLSVIDSASMVRSAVNQVTVDNTPPLARITYPQDEQSVEPVRGGVTITAAVEDLVGIAKVEWWLNGKKVHEQTSPPYLYQLKATSGNHVVFIKTWDTAGNRAQSGTVNFSIQP